MNLVVHPSNLLVSLRMMRSVRGKEKEDSLDKLEQAGDTNFFERSPKLTFPTNLEAPISIGKVKPAAVNPSSTSNLRRLHITIFDAHSGRIALTIRHLRQFLPPAN